MRVLNAGVALVDRAAAGRRRPGFAADALRTAAALGAELKDLALPKDKAGRTVVNAASGAAGASAAIRPARSAMPPRTASRAPRSTSRPAWCASTACPGCARTRRCRPDDVARDARILVDYLGSFRVVLRQCRRRDRGLLGVPGLALFGAGRPASAAGRRAGRHRSLGLSGLCGAVSAARAAARRCSPGSPRARCSASRR